MEPRGNALDGARGAWIPLSLINILPFSRIRDWPMCSTYSFSLSRYIGGFRATKQINSKTDARSFTSELVLKSLVREGVGELPLTVHARDQVGLS